MKNFLKDKRGNVVILAAVSLPVLVGTAAFSVDISQTYSVKTSLQSAADAGAYAAAGLITNKEAAIASALRLVAKSAPPEWGNIADRNDIRFGQYNSVEKTFVESSEVINAVEVTTRRISARGNAFKSSFAKIFAIAETEVTAKAIAVGTSIKPCIIALNPTIRDSFQTGGGGTVSVPNCGIWVNSSSATAMRQGGSRGFIKAKFIGIVGSYTGSNISPMPLIGQPAVSDPLAGKPEPVAPLTCTYNAVSFQTSITLPGNSTYCGKITLNANITFGPGIHYFKNAEVVTNSTALINSLDAMLYFDATSKFSSAAGGNVIFRAPISGEYRGIAIFGSRAASNQLIKITGNKDFSINGTVYLPKHNLEVYGSTDITVTSKAGFLIANRFFYQGDSSITFDGYADPGSVPAGLALRVSLVE